MLHLPIPVRRSLIPLAAAIVALLAAAPAGAADTERALNRGLDEIMETPGAPPGLGVLIQRGNKTEYLRRGVADVDTGARFRKRSHYRIASMAKAVNGAVVLGLASDRKLRLRDRIDRWLGGVLPLAGDATLAQALQHTAGLPDYIRQQPFVDELIADPAQYMTPRELLGYVKDKPLEFEPGSEYGYSDTDNIAAGLAAEQASGRSYESLLRRYVYRPAGMRRTSLPRTIKMPAPYIHGYEVERNKPPEDVSEFINPALAWASGGIVSTAADMNRFIRAYVGGDLFSRRIARSQDDFVKGSSSPPGPGRNDATLALFRYRTHCGTVYGHTGSYPGYRLFMASSANGKRSVVFTVNAQIVPGDGSQDVSDLIRLAQEDAVCRALG